jgi:hypothetical protein
VITEILNPKDCVQTDFMRCEDIEAKLDSVAVNGFWEKVKPIVVFLDERRYLIYNGNHRHDAADRHCLMLKAFVVRNEADYQEIPLEERKREFSTTPYTQALEKLILLSRSKLLGNVYKEISVPC